MPHVFAPSFHQHPFRTPTERNAFQLFDLILEQDPLVWFHGTDDLNRQSIFASGFRPGKVTGTTSFCATSGVPLHYACMRRSGSPASGLVIAVQLDPLVASRMERTPTLDLDPTRVALTFLAFCVVPSSYVHQ